VQVLDLTRVLAGPIAARLLADFGADVVKIDRDPAGTRVSIYEPAAHEFVNRGKDSLVIDLATETGRRQFAERARSADVLITNFLPEARGRLGVDEASVREIVNDLVYVHLDTFGGPGPWEGLRGYAELANAVTGITERTLGDGPPSGVLPAIDYPRSPFTDPATGILAAFTAVAALCGRARAGGGWAAETSLVRTAMYEQILYVVGEPPFEPRPPKDIGWGPSDGLCRVESDWVYLVGTGEDVVAQQLVAVDEFFAPGGAADRRGLRRALESVQYGVVLQPGLAIRLDRTPGRAGDLPGPFVHESAG
jgi:crotonobetainyl-CoA:carnitine CoA-transferase CaiB-like acyl-CoA transferase